MGESSVASLGEALIGAAMRRAGSRKSDVAIKPRVDLNRGLARRYRGCVGGNLSFCRKS